MQSVAVIIGFKSTFRVSLTNHVIAEVKDYIEKVGKKRKYKI